MQALGAVAAIVAGRARGGVESLPDPADHDDPELWLWQAIALGKLGEVEEGGAAFARSGQAWRTYPEPLRREVALHAGRTALALGAPQIAAALLDHVDADGTSPSLQDPLALLRVEVLAARGQRGEAEALLVAMANGEDAELARQARFLRHRLALERWDSATADGLAELEADLPAWRGRPGEDQVWRLLATYRAAAGDGPGALEAWAFARRADPGAAAEPDVAERDVMQRLVQGDPPFADDLAGAVAAVHRYPEWLPAGPDRARLLDRLATRVAAETDALHVADSLLVHALAEPLPRALEQTLRLHLAELRLRRHVPAQALDALAPLADVESAAVEELRERALAERRTGETRAATLPSAIEGDTVEDALAAARALLEGNTP